MKASVMKLVIATEAGEERVEELVRASIVRLAPGAVVTVTEAYEVESPAKDLDGVLAGEFDDEPIRVFTIHDRIRKAAAAWREMGENEKAETLLRFGEVFFNMPRANG